MTGDGINHGTYGGYQKHRTEPPPRGSSGLGASATRARLRGFPNDKGLNT